ncbi:MAG: transposase [Chlamydiota bacterium]
MLVNLEGVPIEFHFTPGSVSDVQGLKYFSFDLENKSRIYADKAYNDYQFEDLILEAKEIKLGPQRKNTI